jgi:hypothetical protein
MLGLGVWLSGRILPAIGKAQGSIPSSEKNQNKKEALLIGWSNPVAPAILLVPGIEEWELGC